MQFKIKINLVDRFRFSSDNCFQVQLETAIFAEWLAAAERYCQWDIASTTEPLNRLRFTGEPFSRRFLKGPPSPQGPPSPSSLLSSPLLSPLLSPLFLSLSFSPSSPALSLLDPWALSLYCRPNPLSSSVPEKEGKQLTIVYIVLVIVSDEVTV